MKKTTRILNKANKFVPGIEAQSLNDLAAETIPQTESDLFRLVHELQVHQLELKLQNEELRQTRDEVEAGLERYTDLYDFAPVGYFTLTRGGTIRQTNLTGALLLGVDRAGLTLMQFRFFVTGDCLPAFNIFLKNVFENKVKVTIETVLLRSGNEPLWVKIEAIAMPDGQTCRAAVMDINERKQIESQKEAIAYGLRESETRYRKLADSIDEIFFALDGNLKLTFWNKASEELTGIRTGAAIGKSIYEVFSDNPETRQTAMMCLEALQTQHSRTFIQQNKTAGMDYCFEINIYPSEGELSVMMKDINVRKQEEVALLLESEARFRAIANYTYDWENWMGTDGTLLWVNPAVERITGYSPEEFMLMPGLFEAVILEVDKEKIRGHINNGLKNGQSCNNLEYRIKRKDGSIIWVTISYQPIYSVKGDNIGLRSSIRNITERKSFEETITNQIKNHKRDLSVLYQVATTTSELLDKKNLLDKILAVIFEATHCKAAAIHLFDQDKTLSLETSKGLMNEAKTFSKMLPVTWEVLEKMEKSLEPALIKDLPVVLYLNDLEISKDSYSPPFNPETQPYSSVSYLGVPVLVRDELLGILSIFTAPKNEFTEEQIALITATASHLGLALKTIDLVQRENEQMAVKERAKLARDLHDSVTQSLYSLMLFSNAAQDAVIKSNMEKLDTCLSRISEQSMLANKHLRLLLYELNLDLFEQEGLVNAINDRLDVVERRLGINAQLQVDILTPIPEAMEWNLFYFINEALTNALKHSQAANTHILIQSDNGNLVVEISDNGKGFNVDAILGKGMGLKSMRERAASMGGEFSISSELKKGTKVGIRVRY